MIKKILNKVILSLCVLLSFSAFGQHNITYVNFAGLQPGTGISLTDVQEIKSLYYDIHSTVYVNPEGIEYSGVTGEDNPKGLYFNHVFTHLGQVINATNFNLSALRILQIRWDGVSPNNLTGEQAAQLAQIVNHAPNLKFVMIASEKYDEKIDEAKIQSAFSNLIQILKENSSQDLILPYYVLGVPQ